ncbi:hypothetical protein BN890_40740 [Bacteroides xylanisolvens SD CC 1b]|uniref:Uncharacterized protein n=1 Tax=Bacteroides xylanisolvens SD CC 1b TaxID=702447 RepID=W6P8U9_9BACE|nr:hypothetical protein BN891_26220 [Bacteroides xylanisolvens SD CC 2a]CDM06471.1 hypothetical protein BN890_40740 [Bacteroides xylanisolvens SD CC 1b]
MYNVDLYSIEKVIYTTRNQQYACVIILSDFKYSARIKPFPFNDRLGISI